MLGVLADDHNFAFSLDDFAFLANLLYGWFHLHVSTIPFLLKFWFCLFCSPGDASLGQVIYRNLNGYAVTGENANIVHTKLTRDMRGHDMTVGELHLEACVGQCLNDHAFKFDYVILLCQNNPSLLSDVCVLKAFFHFSQDQYAVIGECHRVFIMRRKLTV